MKKFRPGVSFGDFVVTDKMVRKSRVGSDVERDFRRGWLVWLAVIAGLGILAVRLASLQIFYGERYRLLSDENRVEKIKLSAPRGIIYDRKGEVLATNVKTEETVNKIRRERWKRVYPQAAVAAHVIGYLGEVSEEEVGILKERGSKYEMGDMTGRSGAEAAFEKSLRGDDGGRLVEVDNQGGIARELGRKEPVPGQDLHLALDINLQKAAFESLALTRAGKGAVVASVPGTGEILAMVSYPSYDPDLFIRGNDEITNVLTDENLPVLNRSIGGVYPPGSTFKMVTTTAAIMAGKVKPGFTYLDTGRIEIGGTVFTNWLYTRGGGTEGIVGFARAITRSTDTFFYKVGEMTGPEEMGTWAEKMGLGEPTGVDIPGEVGGVIAGPGQKEKTSGERWYLGNTYQMAIGQEDTLVTPLQLNLMTNVVAYGGIKCKPHLTQFTGGEKCPTVEISKEVLDIIRKGMTGACSPGGTAFPLFDWNEAALRDSGSASFAKAADGQSLPVIACKTGTAEYVAGDGKIRTHGWLTAFAPADDPQISVTVLVEGGGEGSNVAAPIVRKVMAKYFNVKDTYPYGAIRQELGE